MAEFGIDLDKVRSFLAEKEERRRQLLDQRFAHATAMAARVVEAIKDKFIVDRIWQWGSLLDRTRFSERSDIDIALEGVRSPSEFFAILGLAMELSELPVDLIELERVRPSVAERIRRKGRLVYDRTGS